MNIELIVGEIDTEIEKLQRIRAILELFLKPQSRRTERPRLARVRRSPQIEIRPEPMLVVLPPKQRREYTRKVKQVVIEPRALAAPMSNLPVFVPKAALRQSQPAKAAHDGGDLEALMRRRLLGGAA